MQSSKSEFTQNLFTTVRFIKQLIFEVKCKIEYLRLEKGSYRKINVNFQTACVERWDIFVLYFWT